MNGWVDESPRLRAHMRKRSEMVKEKGVKTKERLKK